MICGTKIREKGFHKMKAIEWDKTSTTVECQICNRKECHYEEIKKEVECATCNGSGGEIASDISGLTIECGCGGTGIDYDMKSCAGAGRSKYLGGFFIFIRFFHRLQNTKK